MHQFIQKALTETYNETNAVFMPANTASILQPMDLGIISTFKSSFYKGIAAIDCGSSDRSGKSQLKTWKRFSILHPLRTFVINGKDLNYQHGVEFERS